MIKNEFSAKYANCTIPVPSEYKVKNLQGYIVFDVDKIFKKEQGSAGRRCDEFIFFDINHNITGIYLIERKTNSTDRERVQRQLQGGANFIAGFLQDDPALDAYRFNFRPVLVSRGIRQSERIKLTAFTVELRNQIKRIIHIQHNEVLPKIRTEK